MGITIFPAMGSSIFGSRLPQSVKLLIRKTQFGPDDRMILKDFPKLLPSHFPALTSSA